MSVLGHEHGAVRGDVGRAVDHLFVEVAAVERDSHAVDRDRGSVLGREDAEGIATEPRGERCGDELRSKHRRGRELLHQVVREALRRRVDVRRGVTAEDGDGLI